MTRSLLPFVSAPTTARRVWPFERRVALTAAPPAPPGRYLVLCDRGGVGASVADTLRARGNEVIRVAHLDPSRPMHRQTPADVVVGPDDAGALVALIEATDTPDCPLLGIVHLWGLDPQRLEGGARLQTMARETGLITVTSALEQVACTPRLWIVTRGALPAEAAGSQALQSLLWSFGRVLGVARPQLRPTLVDLDPGRSPREGAVALSRVLMAPPNLRRLVSRRRCWFAPSRHDVARLATPAAA